MMVPFPMTLSNPLPVEGHDIIQRQITRAMVLTIADHIFSVLCCLILRSADTAEYIKCRTRIELNLLNVASVTLVQLLGIPYYLTVLSLPLTPRDFKIF